MLISFTKSDFFKKLFPEVDSIDNDTVQEILTAYYHPRKVKIQMDGDTIQVEFLDALSDHKPNDFYQATDL